MTAVILSVGSELTTGQAVDTNSAWLSARLGEFGVVVRRHESVPDDESAITEALSRAGREADVVVVTGGLGPTEDDRTRHALARALGTALVEDPESWRRIEEYFARRSYPLTPANRRQALVPEGARAIVNTCGTAPGLYARLGDASVYCMPGVPSEMTTMFEATVAPELRGSSGGSVVRTRTLLTFGKGEAAIGEMIADLMAAGRNPDVGTRANEAEIAVRVTARGLDTAECEALLAADVVEIRRRLGDVIFGEEPDTLAAAVGRILTERRRTLSVAESCTGGLLAKLITDVPGSSEYFIEGVVTYADQAKQRLLGVPGDVIERHGAVSSEVAGAMAVGCRRHSDADYALSTTGIAGPTGGSAEKPVGLVYVAVADGNGVDVRELRLGSQLGRQSVRVRACRSALNLLRRRLLRSVE